MEDRAKLDAEWAQLRAAREDLDRDRKEFEAEREASGIEHKLFVGNLNASSTDEDLQKMFSPYGAIKELVLLKDKDGKSKRSCFVKYYSKAAAEKCIAEINDRICDKGQEVPMVVRFAKPKESKAELMSAVSATRANGLFPAVAYGAASPATAYASPASFSAFGATYGAGFGGVVPAAAAASAAGAVGAGSARRGPIGANLYVNNLDRFITEEDVRQMFSDFGAVISVKLFQGYGFVSYDNPQSAQSAIAALNGMMSSDGRRRLEVQIKKDKGDKPVSAVGVPASAVPSRYQPY